VLTQALVFFRLGGLAQIAVAIAMTASRCPALWATVLLAAAVTAENALLITACLRRGGIKTAWAQADLVFNCAGLAVGAALTVPAYGHSWAYFMYPFTLLTSIGIGLAWHRPRQVAGYTALLAGSYMASAMFILHDPAWNTPPNTVSYFGNTMVAWAVAGTLRRAGRDVDAARVDSTPQVGCVAQFPPNVAGAGSMGHVAIVIGVTGGSVTVEDFNFEDRYDQDTMYNYSQHVVPSAGLNFLHFAGGGLTGKVEASPTLNVRSGPGPDHPVVGTVPYGDVVGIGFWARGASVTATWQDGSTWTTDVWDRLAENINGGPGYVSDAWINTGGDTSKQASSC
jgi:hypothetical protein